MLSPLVAGLRYLRHAMTKRRIRMASLLILLFLAAFVLYLDISIRSQFEGRRWALPARVYARPLEMYVGMPLTSSQLTAELVRLNYLPTMRAQEPGSFARRSDKIMAIEQRPL